MTSKLVVIIKSLKVPKIKNILLYEMKFLVPNYSCLQNGWLGGFRPQILVLSVLCLQLNLLNPHSRTKYLVTPLAPIPNLLLTQRQCSLAQAHAVDCNKQHCTLHGDDHQTATACNHVWYLIVLVLPMTDLKNITRNSLRLFLSNYIITAKWFAY